MENNRPFFSGGANVFNESMFTSAPVTFGSGTVTVSHGQNQRFYNTAATSITGNPPQQQFNPYMPNCPCQYPQQQSYMQGQPQAIPGGVRYSFPPTGYENVYPNLSNPPQYYEPRQPYPWEMSCQMPLQQQQAPQPLTLQQHIALKELEKHGLETILLQEQLRANPYMLQLHYDINTSTADLLNCPNQTPPSRATADFQNKSAALAQDSSNKTQTNNEDNQCCCTPNRCCAATNSSFRTLNLTRSPDLLADKAPPCTEDLVLKDMREAEMQTEEMASIMHTTKSDVAVQATIEELEQTRAHSNGRRVSFDDKVDEDPGNNSDADCSTSSKSTEPNSDPNSDNEENN